MDPNQQPGQAPPPEPITPEPMPVTPQTPTSYATPSVEYDPNYLDSIAPPPAQGKFLSGTFGKVFYILIGLFVLGVSLILAFNKGDDTSDLQQIAVRLDNFIPMTRVVQKDIKSKNLADINSTFIIWLVGNQTEAEGLLKKGGVQKTDYSKKMVGDEKAHKEELAAKFEDARLSATLNRVYANTMAAETEKLLNMLKTMSKKSKSAPIREFAKTVGKNLTAINKQFNEYVDDGN